MSSVVAIVKSIVGQVIAVSPEGIRRVLIEGDRLLAGEEVLTGPGGAVTLELADGRLLDLGRDSQWSADTPDSSTDLAQATAQAAPSVEELQQAIAAGVDPTTELEATAAGPSAAGGGGAAGGGHSFVMLEETAGRVDPTVGFPTEGLSSAAALNSVQVGQLGTNNNLVTPPTTDANVATDLVLGATPSISEAGGVIVYTATVGQAPTTDLVITLSNGAVITIPAGQASGSVNVQVPANDTPYIDGGQISTTVTGSTGGGGLTVTLPQTPAVTQVTDTIDTTTATLTASPSVTEGGVITYTVTLSNPAQTPVTVTLSNGQTVTVEAGKTQGSVDFQTPANDVYNNGSTISVTIENATGGNFEQLTPNPTPAQTTINDSVDTTTATLTASPSVTEGGVITYTVTLSNPAQTPVTVTLSNGQTVTVEAGKTQGSVDFQTPANDVYNNGSTVSVTIENATGGNFEQLTPNPTPAQTTINDSVDTTTATLTAAPSVTEGGVITYTVTLSNPAQTPVTVTLSNGQTVTVEAGKTQGSVDFQTPANDVYNNGSTVNVTIDKATGGNFEQLTPDPTPASTVIQDSIDPVTVSIVSNGNVTEDQQPVFTVKVSQALDRPLTVTLSNGDKVTIEAGKTEVEYKAAAQGDDVFKDPGSLTLGVTDASVPGATFEKLEFGSPATVEISDTISEVVATLTASPSVTEGGEITYTITLTNKDGLPINNPSDLYFKLTDGTNIVVAANSTTGSATVIAPDNVYVGTNAPVVNAIDSVSGQDAWKFEQLTLDKAEVSTQVTDEPGTPGNEGDIVKVTITADQVSVAENVKPTFTVHINTVLAHDLTVTLSNNAVVTIKAGQTSSEPYTHDAQGDDVYQDAGEITLGIKSAADATGAAFENLQLGGDASVKVTDTIDEVVAKLTATPSVAEGGEITYTITLTNKDGLPINNHAELFFKLTDGTNIVVAANSTTGSATVIAPDNVYVGTNAPVVNAIDSVSGQDAWKFEQLTLDKTEVQTQVTDEPSGQGDLVKVSIAADQLSVNEATAPTFTVTLNKALDKPFTVTLSTGATLTFAAGETTKSYAAPAQGDDVFKDEGKITVSITKAEVVGEQLENLQIGQPATVAVTDTQSPVTAQLTVDNTTVAEGGKITYTVTLVSADPSLPVTNHKGLTFTLTDGTTVTVKAGEATGSVTVTAPDNVYVNDPVTITQGLTKVEGAGADQFEQLNLGKDTVSTVVTDEPGTPGNPGGNNEGDLVKVSIVADQVSVNEATEPTFTVTLNKALDKPFTVTLSTGATLTFAAGETTKSYAAPAQGDDVFKDEG
ncbi:retention module-containing protein, partial [Pseudomonas juntendi]|uniref:retention module-containing protein n=1 Tax=Pseudomonas juntendi TaxID=2666183 RepID=UPI00244A0A2E